MYGKGKQALEDEEQAGTGSKWMQYKKIPPGSKGTIAALVLELQELPKVSNKNVDALWERFLWYIKWCDHNGLMISNMAAYVAVGVSVETVNEWEKGGGYGCTKAHQDLVRNIKKVCAAGREIAAQEGLINPIYSIFLQKIHDNFTEPTQQQHIVLSRGEDFSQLSESTELSTKYLEAIGVEDMNSEE
jgi:hypothetical protein